MKLILLIFMSMCTAYVILRAISYIVNIIIKFVLRHRLDKGSSDYKKFKSNLENCIRSGEINAYYDGFQFIKIDKSVDSREMSELQSDLTPLTSFEKYKLKVVGKRLIDQL